MNVITIPKRAAYNDDLVVIPRKEYEALLELKKVKEFAPTLMQRRALARAERDLARGKTLTYHALVKKLGFKN